MKWFTVSILLVFLAAAGCSVGRRVLASCSMERGTICEGGQPVPEIRRPGDKATLGTMGVPALNIKPIEGVSAKHGVLVLIVMPESAADKAGIKVNDIIVAVGENDFDAPAEEVLRQFRDRIDEFRPGDVARIKVIREDEVEENVRHVLVFNATLGGRPCAGLQHRKTPRDGEIHPELENYRNPVEKLVEALLEHYGLTENYEDLRKRLRKIGETGDEFRLPNVAYLHRNPFHMEKVATGILDSLAVCGIDVQSAVARQLAEAMKLLGVQVPTDQAEPLKTGLSLEEHLLQLAALLEVANREREKAFAALSEEEVQFIRDHFECLGKEFEENIFIHLNEDREELRRHLRLIRLASKVDHKHLYNAARELLRILSPSYLSGLVKDLHNLNIDLAVATVGQKDTPFGKIIIGGTTDQWYRKEDAAIIIELGGDDFYTNNAGSSTKEIGVAIVVDLTGNDAYESTRTGAQGAGILGVGILADLTGNDSYIGLRWCQAVAMLGIGMLLDGSGDDSYRAQAVAQGLALWGVGLAIDLGGNDRYKSHLLSQGVGLPFGLGILSNTGGDDSYYSKGLHPSGYGTPGVFRGWSQGVGVGFRGLASGGIGLLIDTEGNDIYEAGNFSQGGGYSYGWGILNDRGHGNDKYIGSRFAQGFTAHQALGTFIEEGGNDIYISRNAVHAGLAWSQSVTLFIDRGGDDIYDNERGFSQGASAHNSITIFIDHGGEDTYAVRAGPGRAGGNTYFGGTSLSVFIDLGGEEDSYRKRAENNAVISYPEDSLILDLPGKDFVDRIDEIIKLSRPRG